MGQFVNLNSPDGFTLPVYVARPATAPRGAIWCCRKFLA